MVVSQRVHKSGAIALSLLMAIGFAAFGGVKQTAYAAEREGGVGYGKENGVTVTVTPGETTRVVSDAAGQYLLYAEVAEMNAENYWMYSLGATVGETYTDLLYSEADNVMYLPMTVQEGTEIALSTYSETAFEATLYFGDLVLDESVNYNLYGITLPATFGLGGTTQGRYIISVYPTVEEYGTISVSLDGETWVDLTVDDNRGGDLDAYIQLSADNKSLSLRSAAEGVVCNVELTKSVVAEQMPQTATLTLWHEEVYSYANAEEGFYLFNAAVEGYPEAYISYVIKTDPDAFEGIYPNEGEPVYMAEGENYYFFVTYTGIPYEGEEDVSPESVTVNFSFTEWQGATVTEEAGAYAPVYTGSMESHPVTLSVEAGDYDLAVTGVPEGAIVTAHIRNEQTLTFTSEEDVRQLTVAGEEEVYFTSDAVAVVWVTIGKHVDTTLTLGVPKTISLNAGEGRVYHIDSELAAGTYAVNFTTVATEHNVVIETNETLVIAAGNTYGTFVLTENAAEVLVTVYNYGETTVTIELTVSATAPATELPLSQSVTGEIGAGSVLALNVSGLATGNYRFAVQGAENISVWSNDVAVSPAGEGVWSFSVYTFSPEERVSVTLFVRNGSGSAVTVTARAYTYIEELIPGEATRVAIGGEDQVTFQLTDLEAGTYSITIVYEEGSSTDVQVEVNIEGISYSDDVFDIYDNGTTVTITFTNNSALSAYFTVTVAME